MLSGHGQIKIKVFTLTIQSESKFKKLYNIIWKDCRILKQQFKMAEFLNYISNGEPGAALTFQMITIQSN